MSEESDAAYRRSLRYRIGVALAAFYAFAICGGLGVIVGLVMLFQYTQVPTTIVNLLRP